MMKPLRKFGHRGGQISGTEARHLSWRLRPKA
jgi:hypothetical protein